MTVEQIMQLLANYIFPIAVSTYLLVYMNTELKALTILITKLSEKIDKICE